MKETVSFMAQKVLFIALFLMPAVPGLAYGQIDLRSPSGNLLVQLSLEDSLRFVLQAEGQTLFRKVTLAMAAGERQAGAGPELLQQQLEYKEEQIDNPLGISSRLTARYQRALLDSRGGTDWNFAYSTMELLIVLLPSGEPIASPSTVRRCE